MSRDTQIGEEAKQKQVVVGNRSTNWTAEKTKKLENTLCCLLYELVYGPARYPVITGYKKDKSTHYILKFLVHPKDKQ